jgi:vacuolar protein sorting-associated protein VTA1
MKDQLKDHKEISNDPAAATYIENFAIKVFSNADNEDRKGGSSR